MSELILNKQYRIWRESSYLGVATFVDDPFNGECFIIKESTEEGPVNLVCFPDRWELVKPE